MCVNLDNFTTIAENSYLWMYNPRNNCVESYSNVVIVESCKLPDFTAAIFDNRHRRVSNKELDVLMRGEYYLVWSTENNEEKVFETIYYSIHKDMNKKIQKFKNEIKKCENIEKNARWQWLVHGTTFPGLEN